MKGVLAKVSDLRLILLTTEEIKLAHNVMKNEICQIGCVILWAM